MGLPINKVPDLAKTNSESTTLATVDRFSRLLDSKFRIPGTSIRLGLDPVFSLVPVIGDLATYIISGLLIFAMYRHGASGKVVVKMVFNASLDALIGTIPLVGTLFDISFKANNRNVKLLKEHYYERKHHGSGSILILWSLVIFLAALLLVIYINWQLVAGLFNWLF